MNVVTNRFKAFLKKKTTIIYSIVLQISYVFLCFCDLCIFLFFYLELLVLIINTYYSNKKTKIKANNTLLEPKIDF